MRPRSHRGFTLVEIFVVLLLTSSIGIMIWRMFIFDQRRHKVDQNRLSGLHGILLFQESLHQDLKRLAFHLNPAEAKLFNSAEPIEFSENGERVRFRVFKIPSPKKGFVPTELVEYSLDRKTATLIRTVDGQARRFSNVVAQDLKFAEDDVRYDPGLKAKVKDVYNIGSGTSEGSGIHVLKYQITCVSETVNAAADELQRQEEKLTIAGAVPLEHMEELHSHPYHMMGQAELLELTKD